VLTQFDRIVGGEVGGKSTSPAKQRAARRNGRKPTHLGITKGRPRRRTLLEFLLHLPAKSLTTAQHETAQSALVKLSLSRPTNPSRFPRRRDSDLSRFLTYFGLPLVGVTPDLQRTDYRIPPRRENTWKDAEPILESVRVWARWYLAQAAKKKAAF